MLTMRNIVRIKPFKMDEAVALLMKWNDELADKYSFPKNRIWTGTSGPTNTLVYESDLEGTEEEQKRAAGMMDSPEMQEWVSKLSQLTLSGDVVDSTEILTRLA